MEIAVNEFQTPITDELLDNLSAEAREQFLDYITNVEFIKRLISPDRPRAKDLPRRDGKIIVDIVNPHILEDMEYFRPIGNFYRKHGVLTKLRPNPSPNSDYGKWMATEINRIWYGMVRESDGEWITGNMYFYLNYTPIIQSKVRKGTKQADRVVDFPEVWEGTYLWFHYIDQARNGGLYNNWLGGEHAVQIARRGAGKSYTAAAILGKAFICGENYAALRKVKGAVTAYQKEYLVKDGILNKFVDIIDFCAENTEFPASRIKDSINDMHWMMGYKDGITNTNKGTLNEILGISAKDDTDKCHPYSCNVPTPNGTKKWGDIKVGDSLFDAYGNPTKVLKIFEHSEDDIYKITLKDGRCTYATKNHLWEIIYRSAGKFKTRLEPTEFLINNTIFINDKYNLFKWGIRKNGCVQYKEQDLKINPYTMGLFLGDGCYSKSHNNYLDITMLVEDILNLLPYIKYPVKISKYRDITHHIILDSNSRQLLNHYGLKDKNHGNKFIPKEYLINSEANRIELLNGLLDSDGSCTKDYGVIEYSTKSILLRKGFLELCRSLGFNCSYKEKKINGLIYQKCYIYTDDKRLFNLKRKKDRLKVSSSNYSKSFSDKTHIVSVEFSHRDKSKCVIVDNPEHLYLIDDFIVTHNSRGKRSNYFIYEEFGAFPKFIDIWNVNKSNVLEDDIIFGQAIAFGTGGSEGSDFSGALEMIYNPIGYQVYPLPNVFDKNSQGKQMTVFFFGAYLNRKGCFNENGVSDVVMALLQEIQARIKIKYNSTDTMTLTRKKAEQAITILEAVMKRDGTFYPIADLTDVHNELEFNPRQLDSIGVGELSITKTNEIVFKPTNDAVPIREFPHKDNKLLGCVEVHMPPVRDSSGKVMHGRYIAGIDPYDDDASDTLSLGSLIILDLFTDLIVFEYTGRPMFADDFYETCRRALIWYNAECNYENNKKGLFKYFSQHNSLYLLSDTLDFLKDKELMKPGLYGNKAKGTISSAPIKAYGRRCIRDWLLKPVTVTLVIDREEVDVTVPALTQMKTKALLKELMLWNPDGNFDRHDALAMLMLLREEKLRVFGVLSPTEALNNTAEGYLGNDSYFETNYDKKFVGKTRMPSYFNKQ